MNNQEALMQLQNMLQQLQMRLQVMQRNTEAIPDVEWQLLLNDTASLYDMALFAKNQSLQKKPEKEKTETKVEGQLNEITIEALSAKFPSLNQVLKKEGNVETVSEFCEEKTIPKIIESPQIVNKQEKEAPKIKTGLDKQPIIAETENNLQNIAEKYKTDQKTLNDSLQNSINSIGIHMQHQPIGDIKKAIGINEKFLFIKELFNNSEQSYYNAIDELNHCDNYQNAIAKMNDFADAYQWVQESPICLKLHDLIRRRYIR